eukprot:CAMPEP_0194281710 /NCGR_PEP_ID=MMETSP0169-20130528/21377_1 /TAXON_ID=218684 /ORGANISM="Corethron pennatum, Strain L29A3" /LENGTH=139 /DNA_ID=CAMNT_0039026837 /DNA_START=22 /DNA_END=438 /DNA_ORIENTATION=-
MTKTQPRHRNRHRPPPERLSWPGAFPSPLDGRSTGRNARDAAPPPPTAHSDDEVEYLGSRSAARGVCIISQKDETLRPRLLRSSRATPAPARDGTLWTDAHAPLFVIDLAVHPKKVEEVRSYLAESHPLGQLPRSSPPP